MLAFAAPKGKVIGLSALGGAAHPVFAGCGGKEAAGGSKFEARRSKLEVPRRELAGVAASLRRLAQA
jgi:hypothetical protein